MSFELKLEIKSMRELINTALTESKKRGLELATKKKEVDVGLANKVILLKEEGHPVSLIKTLANGAEDISQLNFELSCSEVLYKNALEAINVYKKELAVLLEEYKQEWEKVK